MPPPAPRALLGRGTSGPILWPNQKKKCLPNIDFLSNQPGGEKEHSRKLIIFSATNRSETLFFSLQYFPTSKEKRRINIKNLGLNNKTLQNQFTQADLFNQNSTKTRYYKFDSLNIKNDFHCKSLSSQRGEGDERVADL